MKINLSRFILKTRNDLSKIKRAIHDPAVAHMNQISRKCTLVAAALFCCATLGFTPAEGGAVDFKESELTEEQLRAFLGEKVLPVLTQVKRAEVYKIMDVVTDLKNHENLMKQDSNLNEQLIVVLTETQLKKARTPAEIQSLQREKQRLEDELAVLEKLEKQVKIENEERASRLLSEVRMKFDNKEYSETVCLTGGTIRGWPVTAKGRDLSREQIEELRSIVTDLHTYNFRTEKHMYFLSPEVAFLLHGGSKELALFLYFKFNNMAITVAGSEEKISYSEFAGPRLATLVKQLFPNDPEIQALPLSRKE